MTFLDKAVRHAFSRGGPVERIMGQHRVLQQRFAVNNASFADSATLQTITPVMVQEVMAGIGKTLAIGIVLGLDALLNGHRGLVATFTRSLRAEYLRILPLINKIVKQTLEELGSAGLFRPITMAEFTSTTSYLSPLKINQLESKLALGLLEPSSRLNDLITYFHGSIAHGRMPDFAGYYAHGGLDGGPGLLPERLTELDLAMCSADREHPLAAVVRDENAQALDADILLVTHAMLTMNSMRNGQVLKTALNGNETPDDPVQVRNGLAYIDEADKLPAVAYVVVTAIVSRNIIAGFLEEVLTRYAEAPEETRYEVERARVLIEEGLEHLTTAIEGLPPGTAVVLDSSDVLSDAFIQAVKDFDDGLRLIRRISQGNFARADRDVIIADQALRLRQETVTFEHFDRSLNPKMEVAALDVGGVADIRVTLNLGLGRGLISQLWRPQREKPHNLKGVVMVSAALSDLPPFRSGYTAFLRDIDYDPGKLDAFQTYEPMFASRAAPWGMIENLAVIHRETVLRPTDTREPDLIDRRFLAQAVIGIDAAINRLKTRRPSAKMVVLCPSYALVDLLYDALSAHQDRIIQRRRYSSLHDDMRRLEETPHGIWLGTEWEGVNFVNSVGETMVSTLVITRLPVAPPNNIRRDRRTDGFLQSYAAPEAIARGQGTELLHNVLIAYRKVVQGLGRGIRSSNDRLAECLILDQRFPVPPEVSRQSRQIAQLSEADPTRLFQHFDQALMNRYKVRRWSKMEPDGSLVHLT